MKASSALLYDPGLLDGLDDYFTVPGKKYWAQPTRGIPSARINEPYPGNRQDGLGFWEAIIGGAVDLYGAKSQLDAQKDALKTQLAVAEKKRQAMALQLEAAKEAKAIAILQQQANAKSAAAGLIPGLDLKTLAIPAAVIGGVVLFKFLPKRRR